MNHDRSSVRRRSASRWDNVPDRSSSRATKRTPCRAASSPRQRPLQSDGSMDHLLEFPALQGSVVTVAIDAKHRFSKTPCLSIVLKTGKGVEGDAHYGQLVRHRYLARQNPRAPNLRQVHLIPSELYKALRNSGFDVGPGDLGENITTTGLDLERLPLNTQFRIGASVNIRLTGLRTPCILIDRFKSGLKSRLLAETPNPPFRAGVMAVVSEGGEISPGDPIRAVLPDCPHRPLPPL
ncbi:MOSC domain-containing protein YiiM [Bradyrhizobium sp. USDA 4452]